jgi:hypothetical protein
MWGEGFALPPGNVLRATRRGGHSIERQKGEGVLPVHRLLAAEGGLAGFGLGPRRGFGGSPLENGRVGEGARSIAVGRRRNGQPLDQPATRPPLFLQLASAYRDMGTVPLFICGMSM